MKLSRRQLLARGGATAAVAALPIPVLTTTARAVTPTAALGLAQVGFDLYKMSRGGGGGIGSLLAAQTEMLSALSAQITAIGNVLMQVYADIQQIRDILSVMPVAVSEAVARRSIQGDIGWAASILKTIDLRAEAHGKSDALEHHKDEVEQALYRIRPHVAQIETETAVANSPLLCLAWYTELQLMLHQPQLDVLRLRQRAQDYAATLNRWIPAIEAELRSVDADAARHGVQVTEARRFARHECATDRWDRYQHKPRGCGHDGNHTCFRSRVDWTINHFGRAEEALSEDLTVFLEQAAAFEANGIQVADSIQLLSVPSWAVTSRRVDWMSEEVKKENPAYHERMALYGQLQCQAPVANPSAFAVGQNGLLEAVQKLRLKAIVHSHFLLASLEARRSMEATSVRLGSGAMTV